MHFFQLNGDALTCLHRKTLFWGMKNLYLRVREIQAKLETKQYIFQVVAHNYAKILWREKSMQNIFEWFLFGVSFVLCLFLFLYLGFSLSICVLLLLVSRSSCVFFFFVCLLLFLWVFPSLSLYICISHWHGDSISPMSKVSVAKHREIKCHRHKRYELQEKHIQFIIYGVFLCFAFGQMSQSLLPAPAPVLALFVSQTHTYFHLNLTFTFAFTLCVCVVFSLSHIFIAYKCLECDKGYTTTVPYIFAICKWITRKGNE